MGRKITAEGSPNLQFSIEIGVWMFWKEILIVNCVQGVILHEMMHAMGFYHEQSRRDRNEYVRINYENIKKGRESTFSI